MRTQWYPIVFRFCIWQACECEEECGYEEDEGGLSPGWFRQLSGYILRIPKNVNVHSIRQKTPPKYVSKGEEHLSAQDSNQNQLWTWRVEDFQVCIQRGIPLTLEEFQFCARFQIPPGSLTALLCKEAAQVMLSMLILQDGLRELAIPSVLVGLIGSFACSDPYYLRWNIEADRGEGDSCVVCGLSTQSKKNQPPPYPMPRGAALDEYYDDGEYREF